MRYTRIIKWLGAAALTLTLASLGASPAEAPNAYNEDPTVGETGWGQACARAMLVFFEGKVDIAMISAGELPELGPMQAVDEIPDWDKLKDIEFVLAKISGADLITALNRSVKYMPRKNTNLLHLEGLTVLCKSTGETNEVSAVTIGAKPVIPDQIYRIATTKFLASGGGPFVGLKSLELISKEPHSLARQIRLKLFPRGRVSPPSTSYIFPPK
jgi:hypothetical protein